jgi:hypothetical protein
MLYRGKNNQLLKIYPSYRPNPPSVPFSVYVQHRQLFLSNRHDICPRQAFLTDLSQEIQESLNAGYHLIVLLDANDDMRNSNTSMTLSHLTLREAIMDHHGSLAPSTYKQNSSHTPIDGIWISPGLDITGGGYLPFDQLFSDTDHRGLWIDISFISAFGCKIPPIIKPKAR